MFWEYFFDGAAIIISMLALAISLRKDHERVIVLPIYKESFKQNFESYGEFFVNIQNRSTNTIVKIVDVAVYQKLKGTKREQTMFSWRWNDTKKEIPPRDQISITIPTDDRGKYIREIGGKMIVQVVTATGKRFYSKPFIAWPYNTKDGRTRLTIRPTIIEKDDEKDIRTTQEEINEDFFTQFDANEVSSSFQAPDEASLDPTDQIW